MKPQRKKRAYITKEVETKVFLSSRRRCCLCYYLDGIKAKQRGQIAHLNRDSANSDFSNLVFLCLNHHDEYDSRSSQSKNYTLTEVKTYRDRLYDELELAETLPSSKNFNDFSIEYDFYEELQFMIKNAGEELDYLTRPWRNLLPAEIGVKLFAFKSPNRFDGICRIERINLLDERVVIICEQVEDNPGNSITNAVEAIAFQVCQQYRIDPQKLVWIEHYPYSSHDDSEWDLVSFEKKPLGSFFEGPRWKRMEEADWIDLGFRPKRNRSQNRKTSDSRFSWIR